MKKLSLTIALAFAVILMTQCRKTDVQPMQNDTPETELIEFTLSASSGGEKAGIDGFTINWSAGDKVFVVDMDASGNGLLGCLSAVSGGTTTTEFKGGITAPAAGHRCMFYYVGSNTFTLNSSGQYSFSVASQNGALNGNNGMANKMLLMKSTSAVTVTDEMLMNHNFGNSSVTFKSMIAVSRLNFTKNSSAYTGTVTMTGGYATATLNAKTGALAPSAGNVTLSSASSSYYVTLIPASQDAAGTQILRFVCSDGTYAIITPTVAANKIYNKDSAKNINMTVPVGALPKQFSVGASTKVYFSKGNLQWSANNGGSSATTHTVAGGGTAEGTWRFANNQYDYVGSGNSNISQTYSGWIDLFGWGTSGYANSYPYLSTGDYSVYGPAEGSINGTNYDWGVYNAISNGGNAPGLWRTLTADEWYYLLNSRTNAASLWGLAKVTSSNVPGLVILPDGWTWTGVVAGLSMTAGLSNYANVYNDTNWAKMDAAGALFVVVEGCREGSTILNSDTWGYSWTATRFAGSQGNSLDFSTSQCNPYDRDTKHFGHNVRLVR